jgi:uroporphyrinogen-III synthase
MKAYSTFSSVTHPALSMTAPATHPTDWTSEDVGLELLNRIAGRMSSAAPLQDVLNDVVEFVVSVVRCDSCLVYLLEGEELALRASTNPCPEVVNRVRMKMEQGTTGWAAQRREPVVVAQGAYEDSRFKLFNELVEERFEAFLSIPLVSAGRLVGVMNVQHRAPHSFSKREIALVATLGFLVGAEVERARLASENSGLSERLEARKIIERAKGILQRDLRFSEEDAYLTLQRESRQRRKSMREVAEAVILSEDLKRRKVDSNA